jgi:glutamate racemase
LIYNPVAVFDSGIGSLSIVRELRKEIPFENILYFADRAHFPYGNKTHSVLRQIMADTVRYLQRYKPKLIVVASNTPSVQVMNELYSISTVPLIGVKPPLEEASRLTRKRHIGIIGTTGTIRSKEFDTEIRDKVPQDILVSRYDVSPIIKLIEEGVHLSNERRTYDAIFNVLGEKLDANIDVMVLASTHLPFVRNYLGSLFPSVKLLDPSKNVAKQVKRYLISNRMLKRVGTGRLEILVSDKKKEFENTIQKMGIFQPVKEVFLAF